MPRPLTVSCFSKIQIGFTFLVLAHPGSPGQRAVKRVCVLNQQGTFCVDLQCCGCCCVVPGLHRKLWTVCYYRPLWSHCVCMCVNRNTSNSLLMNLELLLEQKFPSAKTSRKEVRLKFVYRGAVMPSVLWCCWLGGRKGIWLVKNWVVRCWHGYLSGARCRLAYGLADSTATRCLLLQ